MMISSPTGTADIFIRVGIFTLSPFRVSLVIGGLKTQLCSF